LLSAIETIALSTKRQRLDPQTGLRLTPERIARQAGQQAALT